MLLDIRTYVVTIVWKAVAYKYIIFLIYYIFSLLKEFLQIILWMIKNYMKKSYSMKNHMIIFSHLGINIFSRIEILVL